MLKKLGRPAASNNLYATAFVQPGERHVAYFRGLPRFAKTSPCESAVHRSRPANLSASLRSGPGGIRRASSKASAARLSQSRLSGRCGVSMFIVPQSSRCLDLSKSFDGKTLISAKLFPP
jgi:hypothetical protein